MVVNNGYIRNVPQWPFQHIQQEKWYTARYIEAIYILSTINAFARKLTKHLHIITFIKNLQNEFILPISV